MENKDAAYLLFLEGWDQKRIAAALRVTEKTITTWKKQYDWDRKRTEKAIARETSEEKLWKLISYQLTALEQRTEEWIKDSEYRLLDKGDIDALAKMYSAVKNKQHTWAQIVEIITELLDYLQARNFKLAKEVLELTDEFLMNKKNNL